MRTLADLLADIRREAGRADFPVDTPVYEKAGKDPKDPILFAGSMEAKVCIFGRDLGKDEVACGQPLIGAGGKLVRQGLMRARRLQTPNQVNDDKSQAVLEHAILTNTVPYKPPGNKAYSEAVKARFRPFLAELLTSFWTGRNVICLGNEAFAWFAAYADRGDAEAFWKREDRYQADFPCHIEFERDGQSYKKSIVVAPLPHPSPLNARWYGRFPLMLDQRLASISE